MTAKPSKAASLYFVHPMVDYAFVGLIAVLVYVLARLSLGSTATPQWAGEIGTALLWVGNWPHFSATVYRLYSSPENRSQYPATTYFIPILVLAGICFSLNSPEFLAPYFVKLFMIWSPYHFSGQTLGFTLVYARRAGVTFNWAQRKALAAFIFGTYFFSTLRAETGVTQYDFYGVKYPTLGVPPWMPLGAQYLMYTGGALFLLVTIFRLLKTKKWIPFIVFFPALTQFLWFVYGSNIPTFYHFVPFFHSFQYMLFAWAVQVKDKQDRQGIPPSVKYVSLETFQWYVVNVVGGAMLFWGIPHLVSRLGFSFQFATAIIISGVQIHHFFVDGVIWKLRRANVSSPLMSSIKDMITPTPLSRKKAA